MTTNSIAISRNLVAAGLELTAANAIAEEMVTNADETLATKEGLTKVETGVKADLAKLEATTKADLTEVKTEMKSLATKADLAKVETRLERKITEVHSELRTDIKVLSTKINVLIALMIGLFIVFIADILMR